MLLLAEGAFSIWLYDATRACRSRSRNGCLSGSSSKDCGAVIYSTTCEYDALGVFLFLLCSHRMFSGMSQVR